MAKPSAPGKPAKPTQGISRALTVAKARAYQGELTPQLPGDSKTALEFLQAQTAPVFKGGHTLLPLSWWSWPLTVETYAEMAERWGYALDVRLGKTGEELDSPTSDASRLVALHLSDPAQYPIFVQTRRVMFENDLLPGLLSSGAWCHDSLGAIIYDGSAPFMKPYIDDADAIIIGDAEVERLERLDALGATVTLVLNGSEYPPTLPAGGSAFWHQDPEVDAWMTALNAGTDEDKITAYAGNKQKEEEAVRDAVLSVFPSAEVIYYYTGDSLRGIVSEIDRLNYVYPYRFMINGGTIPSWEIYYSLDGGWMPDSQQNCIPVRATNSLAQNIEDSSPLSYNWPSAGWSLTNPSEVADDDRYMGFLKYLYTLGSVGNVASYFSYPPEGFEGEVGTSPPDWLRQITLLAHAHATFTYLENYLRSGTLLVGNGNHVFSLDLYGQPSWTHPSYEFTTSEGTPAAHVAARKLNASNDWLIIAWAASGSSRTLSATISTLGSVTLLARPEGSLYRATPGPTLVLLDPDGMNPSASIGSLL
jgi:hypothetical protein